MRIAVIAPPWITVPPRNYGGTELIVDILCRGYAEAGHEPILFASGDSACPVRLQSCIDRAAMPPEKYSELLHLGGALRACRRLEPDVVHSHLEAIQPFATDLAAPVVATLHIELTEKRRMFLQANDSVHYVSISAHQQRSLPLGAHLIHHGIEVERYPMRKIKQPFLLFLGEISRRKGVDVAVRAWMALARPVKIAGYVPPPEEDWVQRNVMAKIRLGSLEFCGPVDFQSKVDLLSNARAVLCPARWDEPFGLVAIEAMACGTPVVATRRGALPELIEDGVTGFLCDSEEELIEAAQNADRIDPEACRRHVAENFGARSMVEQYIRLFEELLSQRPGA